MNKEKKKFDVLDLRIDKSLKYKAAAFSGAFMHLTFLVIFFVIKLYTMTIFNVFSVTLYIVMGALCTKDSFEKRALNWIRAMYFEISVHAFLCTLFLGADTCFFLYMMMTIPVVLYYLFLTCSNDVFKRWTIIFMLVSLVLLAAGLIIDHFCTPVYFATRRELSVFETDMIRAVNIAFNLVLLFGFSTLFILEIHSLIKKLNETNERLNFTATHDALTGLYNRYSLNGMLSELKNSSEPFCIVMGDIDDFKKVNDTYGHECGDIVLKKVSQTIMNGLPENSTACRWGGEEILMIMHGTSDVCLPVISRIKSDINSLGLVYEGREVRVSMTFGFAESREGSIVVDDLLNTVDKRLYKGKASGKNVIIVD